MNNKDSQIQKIKEIYPNAKDICQPKEHGNVHDIYIVTDDSNDKFVCRFSSKNTAIHNLYASKLLSSYGIKVPDVSLHKYGRQYCETYPFIHGKTFFERINDGISKEKQDQIYNQMFNLACKISEIPYNCKTQPCVCLTYKMASCFFNSLNQSDLVLCHTDLHAKNVVLDDNDNVAALLDLDAVYPEYMAFALIMLIKDAQTFGCDSGKLIKLCEGKYMFPKFISIDAQTKLYSKIKKTVKSVLGENMVKQILKIRVK